MNVISQFETALNKATKIKKVNNDKAIFNFEMCFNVGKNYNLSEKRSSLLDQKHCILFAMYSRTGSLCLNTIIGYIA